MQKCFKDFENRVLRNLWHIYLFKKSLKLVIAKYHCNFHTVGSVKEAISPPKISFIISNFKLVGLIVRIANNFAKLSSSPVPVKSNLNWDLHYNHCETTHPTHPPRASIFEPLLDYIGSWNLVWKLYSTQLGQLGN